MRAQTSPAPATFALLLASLLASVIAVGALMFTAWRDYVDAIEGAERLSQQIARLLEEHTQRYVGAPEQALRRLDERFAETPMNWLGGDTVRHAAENLAGELPQVSSLFIADDTGKVIMLTGDPNRTPINVADREYFRAHMVEGHKEAVVGPLILSREPQPRKAFTVSIPLIRSGTTVGVIAATLDVGFFQAFYDSLELPPGSSCAVFNDHGWLVVRHQFDSQAVPQNYRHLDLFKLLANAPVGTYTVNSKLDGVRRLYSYRRVAGLPLVVNAGLPWQQVVDGWRHRQMRNAALMLALLGLVQGALWLTWRGVRRERTLTAGLQRALDDNVTLFNEIHHRVKNNMQIVSSMLMIEQIRAGDGPLAERLQLVADRVSSMALVHTMLYERQEASRVDISAYLVELCRNLAESHGAAERGIRIEVTADDSRLAMDHAVPLGLLVNEAVSNALKHAFPHGRLGTIGVQFTGSGGDTFVLAVMDDGIGLPAQPKSTGIGTAIMRSLAGQLDAETTLTSRPDGPGTVLHVWRGVPQPVIQSVAECA